MVQCFYPGCRRYFIDIYGLFDTGISGTFNELTEENVNKIREFVYNNLSDYEEYLAERYTSRSGFISFHPNHFEGWKEKTNDFSFTNESENDHALFSVMEFIVREIEVDDMEVYEDVMGNLCISEFFYIENDTNE